MGYELVKWTGIVRIVLANSLLAFFLLPICIPAFVILQSMILYQAWVRKRHISVWLDIKEIGTIVSLMLRNMTRRPAMIRPPVLDRLIEYSVALKMLEEASPYRGSEKTIVDLGCGQGYFPLLLAIKGHDVVCMDIDKEAIVQQKLYYDKFRYDMPGTMHPMVASATSIPIKEKGISVSAISTIEHIVDDVSVFREIGRLLGTEGKAAVSFAYSERPLSREQQAKKWELYREYHPTYGPFSIQEKILSPSGCSITNSFFFRAYARRSFDLISKLSGSGPIAFIILDLCIGIPLVMLGTMVKPAEKEGGWVFTLEPGPSVTRSREPLGTNGNYRENLLPG